MSLATVSKALKILGSDLIIERLGDVMVATGPERTLVEGFRRPFLAGGFEELVLSASGFTILDLDLLRRILQWYDTAYLWRILVDIMHTL